VLCCAVLCRAMLCPPPPVPCQVPSDAEEADRKDEALAPTDMNCITGMMNCVMNYLMNCITQTWIASQAWTCIKETTAPSLSLARSHVHQCDVQGAVVGARVAVADFELLLVGGLVVSCRTRTSCPKLCQLLLHVLPLL
jgi:hypothetical protein